MCDLTTTDAKITNGNSADMTEFRELLGNTTEVYSETCTFIHCELGLKVQRPHN